MVHGALSKAVFLVFNNRAFKEGKVFEAENVIPIAAESACSWPDSGLLGDNYQSGMDISGVPVGAGA